MAFVDSLSGTARIWDLDAGADINFAPIPPAPWDQFGSYRLRRCVLGSSTAFCEGILVPFNTDVLVVHDFATGGTFQRIINTAGFKVFSAAGDYGLYFEDGEVRVAYAQWNRLYSVTAATAAVRARSSLIGHFGEHGSSPTVDYLTTDPILGDVIEAVDPLGGVVLSRQSAAQSLQITQPIGNDVVLSRWAGSGRVFLHGNSSHASSSILAWDPTVTENPWPEPPSPPKPVQTTPMIPVNHGENCRKLDKLLFGPEFAIVEASECGQNNNQKELSVVATRSDWFVYRGDTVYQVFKIDDWKPGSTFDVKAGSLAYETLTGIKVVAIDPEKTGSKPITQDPTDSDTLWGSPYVYPWNVGARVAGKVAYAEDGAFDQWRARLLENQTYRILAVADTYGSDVSCSTTLTDTVIRFFQDGLLLEEADVNLSGLWPDELPDCAGLTFTVPNGTPDGWLDYEIQVSRYWPGIFGSPPLDYELYIVPTGP